MKKNNNHKIFTTLGRNSITINVEYKITKGNKCSIGLNKTIVIYIGKFPSHLFTDMPPRIVEIIIDQLKRIKTSSMKNLLSFARREIEILYLKKLFNLEMPEPENELNNH